MNCFSVLILSESQTFSQYPEVNLLKIGDYTLTPNRNRNLKHLDKALQDYVKRDMIKKLKQKTWNGIVANKIEYVNYMANNYNK